MRISPIQLISHIPSLSDLLLALDDSVVVYFFLWRGGAFLLHEGSLFNIRKHSFLHSIGTLISTVDILFPYEPRSCKNCEESAWT